METIGGKKFKVEWRKKEAGGEDFKDFQLFEHEVYLALKPKMLSSFPGTDFNVCVFRPQCTWRAAS